MYRQRGACDMKLWEYSGKRIKITSTNGRVFTGIADFYTSALDNPDEVESLSIWQDDTDALIEFAKNRITHIEIIPAIASVAVKAV